MNKLVKHSLKFGMIAAVVLIVLNGLVVFSGFGKFSLYISSLIVIAIFIFFALYSYKKYYKGGTLQLWQGLSITYLITFLVAIISLFSLWAFMLARPEFVKEDKSTQQAYMEKIKEPFVERYGEEKFNEQLKSINQQKPSKMAWNIAVTVFIWQILVLGPFPGVVLSVVLRRSDITVTNNNEQKPKENGNVS